MTKPLIYLIAIFALWLYFKYGNFSTAGQGTSNGGGAGREGGGGSSGGAGASRSFGEVR